MNTKEKLESILDQFRFTAEFDFTKIPKEEHDMLFESSRIMHVKRKQIIYKQEEKAKAVYLVKRGVLKGEKQNFTGNSQLLYFFKEQDFFGFSGLYGDVKNAITVTAIVDSEIVVIDKNIFMELTRKSLPFCQQLLLVYSRGYYILSNRMNVFLQLGKKERLALLLLMLNDKFSLSHLPADKAVEITLTRTDLAKYAGTTLENLIRMINYFKLKKIIRVSNKSIFIERFDELLRYASIPTSQ